MGAQTSPVLVGSNTLGGHAHPPVHFAQRPWPRPLELLTADKLDWKTTIDTRAKAMDFRPDFRWMQQHPASDLTPQPSPGAARLARAYREQGSALACQVKKPEVVREEAKRRIEEAGGDPRCWQLVLSESELQFGQYRGKTLRWLLANDVGYTAAIVASHLREREGGDTSQSPLAVHKDALTSYVRLFPEVVAVVQRTRQREGSVSVRGVDQELVGFGAHARKTYKSLYESASMQRLTYVQWVRTVSVKPGSKRHSLKASTPSTSAGSSCGRPTGCGRTGWRAKRARQIRRSLIIITVDHPLICVDHLYE